MIISRVVSFISYALLWLNHSRNWSNNKNIRRNPKKTSNHVHRSKHTCTHSTHNTIEQIIDATQFPTPIKSSHSHIICHFEKKWYSQPKVICVSLINWKILMSQSSSREKKQQQNSQYSSSSNVQSIFRPANRKLRRWYLSNTNECLPSYVHCTRKCFQK